MNIDRAKQIGARIKSSKIQEPLDRVRDITKDEPEIKKGEGSGYDSYDSESIPKVKKGSVINHPRFGEGAVISKAGAEVVVAFNKKGIKKLNLEYTNVEVIKY